MSMNITLEQQSRSAHNSFGINCLISGTCVALVCKKNNLIMNKGVIAHFMTEAIEIIFIRILGNPPLAFTARLGVRAVCLVIVSLGYAASRPDRQSLKSAVVGATAGSVCTIGIDIIKILNSDDPTKVIAHQGFALTLHNALETARILHQTQHAVG